MMSTYKAFSVLRRESHLVSRLCLIEEIGSSLQETEHCVEEAIDAIACLLSDGHQHFVEACLQCRIYLLCHFVCN